jgi:hypothetical protein
MPFSLASIRTTFVRNFGNNSPSSGKHDSKMTFFILLTTYKLAQHLRTHKAYCIEEQKNMVTFAKTLIYYTQNTNYNVMMQ